MTSFSTSIAQLYLAYFNRPADRAGLAYWTQSLQNGGGLDDIGAAFAGSAEYRAAFLQMTPYEIVGTVYHNLFGRVPEAAGLQYWGKRLADGELRIDTIVRNIADGARGADKASVDAKTRFAEAFTGALDQPHEHAAYADPLAALAARQLLATVRTDAEATGAIGRLDATIARFADTGLRLSLSTGPDALTATPANDTLLAPLGTLQDGDRIDGGAGVADRLEAVVASSGAATLALSMVGVEVAQLRAVASAPGARSLTIDAQTEGVLRWVSDASEIGLVINGVGIDAATVNRDVGIVMRDTAPGDVDFGVYFKELRHAPRQDNVLTLRLSNTHDAGTATPLLNSPFTGAAFLYKGDLVELRSAAIDAAVTFEQLYLAFKQAVADHPALRGVTVTRGEEFSYFNGPGDVFQGRGVDLTSSDGAFDATVSGAGWLVGEAIPSGGNNPYLATRSSMPQQSASASIVIDGVGRGGSAGDLVVGAAGATLESGIGIARFEIEVGDNSRLQTIASTGNALREVVLRNGATSGHRDGDPDLARDKGSLALTGAGLTDVRVLDASAMLGDVSLHAEVAESALAKYGAGTAAGVPGYVYAGGAGNDTLQLSIARGVFAAPTATSGLRDLRFQIDGGAGNDAIAVSLSGPAGAARLEGQLRITGGAGNDQITLDAATAGPVSDLLIYAGQFGKDVVRNFNPAHDQFSFSGLGEAIGAPGSAVSLAHKSVTVAARSGANDSAAEVAALYAGAAAGIHVYVAYDAGNVGAVYAVQPGGDGLFAATLVGSIDLQQTSWAGLGSANFI